MEVQLGEEDQACVLGDPDRLRQLLLNRSQAEIAEALHLDDRQVGSYLRVLMNKFEADSLDVLRAVARRILARQGKRDQGSDTSQTLML